MFRLCALCSLAARGCFLINASLSWRSYKERGRDRMKGVVCIDLIVPFEGSAVSGFWVNTQALCILCSVLTKGDGVKVLPHLSLRIYSLKRDVLCVSVKEDSTILTNLHAAVLFLHTRFVSLFVLNVLVNELLFHNLSCWGKYLDLMNFNSVNHC